MIIPSYSALIQHAVCIYSIYYSTQPVCVGVGVCVFSVWLDWSAHMCWSCIPSTIPTPNSHSWPAFPPLERRTGLLVAAWNVALTISVVHRPMMLGIRQRQIESANVCFFSFISWACLHFDKAEEALEVSNKRSDGLKWIFTYICDDRFTWVS